MSISSHLDESMHVFNNGSTARLMVTPWTRDTVADGYWQNTNTIRPLSARDVYLAECIDNLSANQIVYSGINGITISPTANNKYIISYEAVGYSDTNYKFEAPVQGIPDEVNPNLIHIGLKYDNDTIKLSDNGLYCNNVYAYKSITAIYETTKAEYSYKYTTAEGNFVASSSLPDTPTTGTIYLIG